MITGFMFLQENTASKCMLIGNATNKATHLRVEEATSPVRVISCHLAAS